MPYIRMDQQIFEQIERGRIEPLQIVEEERQRMLWPREHSHEAAKNQLKASLRILGRQLRDWTLLANDEPQLGDQVHNELPIRTQRFTQRLTPAAELYVALGQERTDQALKGLRQGGIGNVSLVLIELAPGKQATRRYQHRLQLVDDRGFADAGIPRDQDQFRGAAFDDPVEGGKQGPDLALATVEFFGNQQPVGRVTFTEWKVD